MAMTVVEPVFVDTNILVYANTVSAPEHLTAQNQLQALIAGGVELWTSRQVLREYMATLTRVQTFTRPVPPAAIEIDIHRFEDQYEVAEDGPNVTVYLLKLLNTVAIGGKQIHDANIVATMLAHNLTRLITDNAADFHRFRSWIEVLPLAATARN